MFGGVVVGAMEGSADARDCQKGERWMDGRAVDLVG